MAKIALLIGVSEYEPGLERLPSAVNDVMAMQQVLTNPEMGEFADADVTVLQNPDRQTMETAIYNLFANRAREDLVLFYFSGHGVLDDGGEFYFASRSTRKDSQGRLVPPTAVAARSVRDWMEQSRSQYKVIILDSCFSGAFAKGVKAKDSGSVNPEQFLGGKGTAILTASTSTQYALTQEGFDLSVYTHYLVEGIRTGGADRDDDGFIGMEELHAYASSKVREAAPAMTPEFYPVKEGYKILLAKSPKEDPSLKYRKKVKLLIEEDEGDFSFISRSYLDDLQRSLALLPGDAAGIETEELEPYRQRRAKVDRYRIVFEGAITKRYPLTERDRLGLQRIQQLLSLRDEDVTAIESPLLALKQVEYERQRAEQTRQKQEAAQQEQSARIESERQQAEQVRQEQKRQEQARAAQLREQIALIPKSQPIAQPQTKSISTPALSRNAASRGMEIATSPAITRQQFLKWAGFGGGGLAVALVGSQILRSCQSSQPTSTPQPVSVAEPRITAPDAGAAKVNGLPLWTAEFETVLVDERGQETQRPSHQAKFVKEPLGNGIELELVSIPAGSFQMGSPSTEAESTDNERPQHSVTLKSFLMGKYPVTQAQWKVVAALPKVSLDLKPYPSIFDLKPDPSTYTGVQRPVEQVSWQEAVEFCARLAKKTGRNYRLPSEAEWEYACRGGTTTPFYFGKTITPELANYNVNYTYGEGPKGTRPQQTNGVGNFPANVFGLYDMHGYVWEWCADHWHRSYAGAPTDGTPWIAGGDSEKRVCRGGSWFNNPASCRAAYRDYNAPTDRDYTLGFRVVCSGFPVLF